MTNLKTRVTPRKSHERTRFTSNTTGESMTKQSFRNESNINIIMAKYAKTGLIDHVKKYEGRYEDVTGVEDYHTSLNRIHAAQAAFMSLPSGVRTKFDNDPGEFLNFVNEPDNLEEMYEMGLAKRPPEALEPKKASPEGDAVKDPVEPVAGDPGNQSPLTEG